MVESGAMHIFPEHVRESEKRNVYAFGVIYIIGSLIVFAILNYFAWTTGPVTELTLLYFVSWTSFYVPLFIFYISAQWKVTETGFTVNKWVGIIVVLSLILGGYVYMKAPDIVVVEKWYYSLIEAFARTGEEVYIRGFIYTLVLKLFQHKKKPWMWAVVLSSIVFAAMHTQTLLPEYGTSIFQIFLFALFTAYMRHLTGSILPGITIHCFLKGGLAGALFGWFIYVLFVLLSYYRGEKIWSKAV